LPVNIFSRGAIYTSMIKKLVGAIIVLFIVVHGGTLIASAGQFAPVFITPDDVLYDSVLAIEMAQYSLTENPEERLMILEESTKKGILAIDNTVDVSDITILIGHFQRYDDLLWDLWDELDEGRAGELAPRFIEMAEKRLQRLEESLKNEKIPYRARENIKRAFQKQQEVFNRKEVIVLVAESNNAGEDGSEYGLPVEEGRLNDMAPGQSGSAPGQSATVPGQSGSTPGQSASAPGQSGSAPGQSGSTPGQSASAPGQSGSAPGQSGSAPGQSGSAPGQSGSAPGQSGSAPGR